jgi:hypothetical protein
MYLDGVREALNPLVLSKAMKIYKIFMVLRRGGSTRHPLEKYKK